MSQPNAERAERGRKALAAYAALLGDGTIKDVEEFIFDDALTDIVTDLMHLYHSVTPAAEGHAFQGDADADLTSGMFQNIVAAAETNFREEVIQDA